MHTMVRSYFGTLWSMSMNQAENTPSQACSFVVSQSAATSDLSQPPQLLEMNMTNTNNNMEGNGRVDVRAPLSAVTTSYNAPRPIGSMDSSGTDATLKVFRRIHFFRLGTDAEVQALKTLMARTLSKTEKYLLGDIYMFYHPRVPNIIRMGVTTRNPEMILTQWRARCSPTLALVSDSLSRPIHCSHRLEQLLHRDLKSKRRPKWCQGCNLVHQQGFEVTEQFALTTVQLWRRWMETEPYDEDGELKPYWKQQIHGPNSPINKEELYRVLDHR